MAGYKRPEYTQVPNELLDKHLPEMDGAELRVSLFVVRKTLGFHKVRDAISLSQLEKGTGLSRQGVIDGLIKAIRRGVIRELDERGKRGVKVYELVFEDDDQPVNSVDQSTQLTRTSQASRPDLVKSVDTQKKVLKESIKKKKDTLPSGNGAPISENSKRMEDRPSKADLDALFDAVALAWKEKNAGVIVNLRAMLFSATKARGTWHTHRIQPPMTLDEFHAFEKYAKNRMAEIDGEAKMPVAPDTIARWVTEFRREKSDYEAQRAAAFANLPASTAQDDDDLIEELTEEQLALLDEVLGGGAE